MGPVTLTSALGDALLTWRSISAPFCVAYPVPPDMESVDDRSVGLSEFEVVITPVKGTEQLRCRGRRGDGQCPGINQLKRDVIEVAL